MPRLIDADEAKKNCERIVNPYAVMAAKAQIDSTETIDAVPVVRCKDCKHFNKEDCAMSYDVENFLACWSQRYDFCSYGERKAGE